MKHLFFLLTFMASCTAFAQTQSSTYREVKRILSEDYYIDHERYANISQGNSFANSFTFYEGTTYTIVALSDDDDVMDVDLVLTTPGGNTYKEDGDASAIAQVTFTPAYTRTLTVKVTNYRSDDPYFTSRCRFVIGHKSASYSSID